MKAQNVVTRMLQMSALTGLLLSVPSQMFAEGNGSNTTSGSTKVITSQSVTVNISPLAKTAAGFIHNKEVQKKTVHSSGFVNFIFQKTYGVKLPRKSIDMSKDGLTVSKKGLKSGDLVFFHPNGKGVSIVGVYEGKNSFIALTAKGITRNSLSSAYWKNKFVTAKRLTGPTPQEAITLFFQNVKSNEALAQLQLDKSLGNVFTAHEFAKGILTVKLQNIKLSAQNAGKEEYIVSFNVNPKPKVDSPLSKGYNAFFMLTEKKNGRYVITSVGTGSAIQN